jgi:hypothetical protein
MLISVKDAGGVSTTPIDPVTSERALIARQGGVWHLWDPSAPEPQPVGIDVVCEVVTRSGDSARPSGRVLPEPWLGSVCGGSVEVQLGDRTVRLTPSDLRAADAASPAAHAPRQRRWLERRPSGRLLPPAEVNPLCDETAGRQLLSDGWITRQLLHAEDLAELRSAYGELHGWSGEGFDPDPGNSDLEYRRKTSAVVNKVLGEPLRKLFPSMVPFQQGFYCKWPDAPATALHQDWTCVDEAAGQCSFQVWVALQPTDEENGHMLVLPGSHRLDRRPRGTGVGVPLAPEMAALETEARKALVPVPLRAGEALIFQLGLVHTSTSNRSSEARLAAVATMRHEQASLVYFHRLSDSAAVRFDADDGWYNSMVPSELVQRRPRLHPAGVVDLGDPSAVERRTRKLLAGSRR